MSQVILVDSLDNEIGIQDKMEAHIEGALHRAFSIFIFNSSGQMLLHRRALNKYHSGGQWTNACCSHPIPNKPIEDTLHERLQFEMGMNCELQFRFTFLYKAFVEPDLQEHELDHIYFGMTDQIPQPNPEEVAEWKYMSLDSIQNELNERPSIYTPWFKLLFPQILKNVQS